MRETQLKAWADLKNSLSDRQYAVMSQMKREPKGYTLFELVDALKVPVNSICGRLTELNQKGFIEDSGDRRVNPSTGKKGIVWMIKNV